MLKVLDLFSGIGGFSLGLESTGGFETVAFCEIEPYPQKVLRKHWPEVPIYDDVRQLSADRLIRDGISVDVITGGFPCQDISTAGKQGGIEAERSGLWSECARLLGDIRPQWAIFENVTNLLNGSGGDWFKRVLWDISQVGYDAEWHCIPASHVGAPHRRDRIWIVSYPKSIGNCEFQQPFSRKDSPRPEGARRVDQFCSMGRGWEADMAHPNSERLQGLWTEWLLSRGSGTTRHVGQDGEAFRWAWATEPAVGRVANGIPDRTHRLKGLGNAVVPQIPEIIGQAILQAKKSAEGTALILDQGNDHA